MKSLGNILFALAVGGLACLTGGCQRINISDDFQAPYERESILMPQASRTYVLAGPPGVRVDIGLDFEESEDRSDRLTLQVGEAGAKRLGARVPGSQLSRAVCGVTLTHNGVPVNVQNLNALRSAPFALRIERSPSRMCQPRRVVPSSALVRR